jgi:hypothetical protein
MRSDPVPHPVDDVDRLDAPQVELVGRGLDVGPAQDVGGRGEER